jgi:hypothetical protein
MKIFAKSRNQKMLKIGEDEKSSKWYFLSAKVEEFVKDNIKKGDEVEVKSSKKGGKLIVDFIKKTSATETKSAQPDEDKKYCACGAEIKNHKYDQCYACNQKKKESSKDDGKKYCACGTEIKNHAYPTCYKCAQEAKQNATQEDTGYYCEDCGKELKDGKYKKCYTCNQKAYKESGGSTKSPDVQNSIKRQAIGHMVSRTIIGLQGQVSVEEVDEVARKLYKLYQELVG